MKISDAKLAELEALREKASRGTWQIGVAGNCNLVSFDGDDIMGLVRTTSANAELIAAMHSALPDLIADLREVVAERDRLREECEKRTRLARAAISYLITSDYYNTDGRSHSCGGCPVCSFNEAVKP